MNGTTTKADRERDLLARLGLPPASGPEAIENAYRDIVGYLARAPRDLKSWARWEAEAAGRAYALLIDPATPADPDALEDQAATAVPPGGPATPPARRGSPRKQAAIVPEDEPSDEELDDDPAADPYDVDALVASVTPGAHRDTIGRPARRPAPKRPAARPAGRGVTRARSRARHPLARRLVMVGALVVGIVAIAFVGYNFGGVSAAPLGGDQPAATDGGLDEAKVAALMARIQADPKDTEALLGLGDAFYAAGDFTTSASWLQKVLDIEPDNVQALVALGAARFNAGDDAKAKASWDRAIELDPDNVEAHYDLGFLYYSSTPQDLDAVRREWEKVIELAPGTQIAQTVKAHLDALASAAPSGSAAPAASADTSSAPSDGPSAAPSGSGAPAASAGTSSAPSAAPAGSAAP
jgi:tetratricopeptide (TPR) repeat protein